MASAQEAVLETAELLEAILLQLDDMQTLLLSQRVSKSFKTAIDRSPGLQANLFFKPALKPFESDDPRRMNSLLEKFAPDLGIDYIMCTVAATDHETRQSIGPVVNVDAPPRLGRAEGSWRRMFPVQRSKIEETWVGYIGQDWDSFSRNPRSLVIFQAADGYLCAGRCAMYGALSRSRRCVDFGKRSMPMTMGEMMDWTAQGPTWKGADNGW